MSDFSDRPFIAGSLVGLRAFSVDALGRLTGPTYGGIFKPGENIGTCKRGSLSSWFSQFHINALPPSPPEPTRSPPPREDHQVGQQGCGCGFYAYFDGTNTYAQHDRITAIIEGYGVCTVGERGFRAEKARLLAIIDPSMRRWWQTWKLNAALAAMCFIFLVDALLDRDWFTAGAQVFGSVLSAGVAVWRWRTEQRQATPRHHLVRRNYPDVPRYPTKRAALKAHPLTPPEPITPDTAADFWERTA